LFDASIHSSTSSHLPDITKRFCGFFHSSTRPNEPFGYPVLPTLICLLT
jgi:hypothetical protein